MQPPTALVGDSEEALKLGEKSLVEGAASINSHDAHSADMETLYGASAAAQLVISAPTLGEMGCLAMGSGIIFMFLAAVPQAQHDFSSHNNHKARDRAGKPAQIIGRDRESGSFASLIAVVD
ncbi:hypothetical protein NM208_g715 [Fusarium decemcellulare]|uniref:Uncharacterized protein n=1 Tax=Fusarium decemcellulare TaxID=57161 RepID=A0ACC1SYP7_9HYPO|nr:hypothetical protein NM208_g715 [Fusarium decemcellulare]